ncbi:MAG: hypothetical protein ABFQ64_02775 [Campylobacterota bacterium]
MIRLIAAFLIITNLYASDDKKASDIFNLIFKEITKKENSNVYIHTDIYSLKQFPGNINIVTDCDKADIVLLSTTKALSPKCKKKILFGSRYSHLKNPNVIGSFFWQKGRPNILFYKNRLKRHKIKLSPSFDKYIEH